MPVRVPKEEKESKKKTRLSKIVVIVLQRDIRSPRGFKIERTRVGNFRPLFGNGFQDFKKGELAADVVRIGDAHTQTLDCCLVRMCLPSQGYFDVLISEVAETSF